MIFPYLEIAPTVFRPVITVLLKNNNKFVLYPALVDSGSDYCVFSIELARNLDIKLLPKKTNLIGIGHETVKGYWGKVEININHATYNLKAVFAEMSEFGHGILGQKGFFDNFKVCFDKSRNQIEINPK